MNIEQYEQLQPHTLAHDLVWLTPNKHCAWRVESLMTKEPDTVAWINQMKPGELLFDVGANMGQYAMLAAKRGVLVHAFEPESQNFALMVRNIAINKLGNMITPWPIALSDTTGFSTFFVTSLAAGNSCNSFGESVDFHLKKKEFATTQGCFGTTLSAFTREVGVPAHIKIDVDGLEHKVLRGGGRILKEVKSVLVETNTHLAEHNAISAMMADFGFAPDLETAEIARRKEGPFTGIGNVIYYRKGA